MTIDDLKKVLEGSDLGAVLPDLNAITDKMAPIMRIALLAGPVILLALGLLYLFASPKEANYKFGYRCYFGMGSVTAWKFTQKLAGIVWGGLGIILAIVAIIGCVIMVGQELSKATSTALTILIIEAVAALLAFLTVEITVILRYDMNGSARKKKK